MDQVHKTSIVEIRTSSGLNPNDAYITYDFGVPGEWRVRVGDTTGVDNTGTMLVVVATGQRVERIFDGPINPKWFGATGNGVTDDTQAIQAAVDGLTKFGNPTPIGGEVRFDPGNYLISSDIICGIGVKIKGQTAGYDTIIRMAPSGTYQYGGIVFKEDNSTVCANVGIENIEIRCGQGLADGHGIVMLSPYDMSYIRDVSIKEVGANYHGFVTGIHPVSESLGQSLLIENLSVTKQSGAPTGVSSVKLVQLQESTLVNCKIFGDAVDGTGIGATPLEIEDCRGITICGGGFAGGNTGINITAITRTCINIAILDGVTIEDCSEWMIDVDGQNGFFVSEIYIGNIRYQQGAPTLGCLNAASMSNSIIWPGGRSVQLDAACTSNFIASRNRGTVTDLGSLNTVIGFENAIDDRITLDGVNLATDNSPRLRFKVNGRTDYFQWLWSATSSLNNGLQLRDHSNNVLMSFLENRLSFFGSTPVLKPQIPSSVHITNASSNYYIAQLLSSIGLATNNAVVDPAELEVTGTAVDFSINSMRYKSISADLALTTLNVVAGKAIEIQITNTDVASHTVTIIGAPFPDGAVNTIPAGGHAVISLQQINGVIDADIRVYS